LNFVKNPIFRDFARYFIKNLDFIALLNFLIFLIFLDILDFSIISAFLIFRHFYFYYTYLKNGNIKELTVLRASSFVQKKIKYR